MRSGVAALALGVAALALGPAAPALAAPGKPCRVALAGKAFDVRCLPALSARGTLVATALIDPDGDRGLPNLEVVFHPLDGRPPASTLVLQLAEVSPGLAGAALTELIEPRLDLVNAQLFAAGFTSLRAIPLPREPAQRYRFRVQSGELELALDDGVLEVRGPRTDPETLELPRPGRADCQAAGPPFVGGLWTREGDPRTIIVRVDAAGTASCPAPPPEWRVLHLDEAQAPAHAAASPGTVAPGAAATTDTAEAARLNTLAMRKLRARDHAGAAAGFRAAIAKDGAHVKAHYNLACVASITGDRETALRELRWLAASAQPQAQERIVKARTDPDLRAIRDDPEVQAILGGPGDR